MRLFIEAVLDDAVRSAAWSAGATLAADPRFPRHRVRWVSRDACHLTLRFLGEMDENRVSAVAESLAPLEGMGRFSLQFDRIGSFAGRRPRVIWVGVAADSGLDRLAALRTTLDASLESIGIEPDRAEYRPHLTLGRVRRQAARKELAAIREGIGRAAPLKIDAAVEQVALVHSTLLKDGPRYRRVASIDL